VKFNIDGRFGDWGDGAVVGGTSAANNGKSRLAAGVATNPSGIGVKLDPIAQIAKILSTLARSAMGFDGVGSIAGVAAVAVKRVSKKVEAEFIISLSGV
jgi:hypothetical protein